MQVGNIGNWTGDVVQARLLEAMRTLHRLPRDRNFQRVRSSWVDDTFARDPVAIRALQFQAELHALELPEEEQEERRRARIRQWARVPPSAGEIARMDSALLWPTRFLDTDGRRFMFVWAYRLGVSNDLRSVAGLFGISKKTAWARSNRLAGLIASNLNCGL